MSATPWMQFRTQLFNAIERRRSRLAIFRFEQMYFFIPQCSKLFNSPGTSEAQEALINIRDGGTFLLVAESLTEFLKMFPQGDAAAAPALAPASEAWPGVREAQSSARQDGGAATTEPQLERPMPPAAGNQPQHHPQPASNARQSSGRPFRRYQAPPTYE
jgi:hypothetical protein